MPKSLYIAEKPSVAQEFSKALKLNARRGDGYLESGEAIVTWCVGHLVTMSYPEAYDPKYKRWSLETLPFLPKEFKYEVIEGVSKQFQIVSGLLNREDVDTIYICTDSGREGEYIYRLVDQMAGVSGKARKRVWIDSQTEEEILRGIREAKDWAEYDNLSSSAYLRAKEDYLMGINFSRLLTLKYGRSISNYLKTSQNTVLSVGRVMTCVLGMAVRREREIRDFVKTPFYRVQGLFELPGRDAEPLCFDGEWKAVEGSRYFGTPYLYKENGFKEREQAQELVDYLWQVLGERRAATEEDNVPAGNVVQQSDETLQSSGMLQGSETPQSNETPHGCAMLKVVEKKKETKNPPLLYNLAELQNDCSRMFKISPDETLRVVQELYERKLVTYPRTDARVLSTAVAKEIDKNIHGLTSFGPVASFAVEILEGARQRGIEKTRYVNDKQITDHYAIIPTGQGMAALKGLNALSAKVYQVVARRFLSIFYPAAVYQKYGLEMVIGTEHFFSSFKVMLDPGYLKVAQSFVKGKESRPAEKDVQAGGATEAAMGGDGGDTGKDARQADVDNPRFVAALTALKKGILVPVRDLTIKEGETTPPKRYTSGSMILAMENAGQLIEDEELRAQIKGSGIGTSATRAEILKKLVHIKYLSLNGKTQVITPTFLGEMVFDVVSASIRQLLNPELTASWEKGLTFVAEGTITPDEYMDKLERFVAGRTYGVLKLNNQFDLRAYFDNAAINYKKKSKER